MFMKKLTAFQTLLLMLGNQRGDIRLGFQRHRLMEEDKGEEGGGAGAGGDAGAEDKPDKDGKYPKSFVEKLLREKNNYKATADQTKAELEALKKANPAPKKDDEADPNKALLKLKDEENKLLKDKLDKHTKEITEAKKLGTLKQEFDKNGGNAKQWELVVRLADVSKIMIDEDSGVVYGAESEVKRIKELAPLFFGKPAKGTADGDITYKNDHGGGDDDDKEKARKDLETKRLKKDKDGKNPLVDFYAAHGMAATKTRN